MIDVTEYDRLAADANGRSVPVGQEPHQANTQLVPGASPVATAEFGPNTRIVRVHTTTAIRYRVGPPGSDASATSPRMAAGQTEYIGVRPGDQFSAVSTT